MKAIKGLGRRAGRDKGGSTVLQRLKHPGFLIVGCVVLLSSAHDLLATSQNSVEELNHVVRPFAVGEELNYQVSIGAFGRVGEAVMRVDGPEVVRGRNTFLLSFDLRARITMFRIHDQTRSWIDPDRIATMRYSKDERHPLANKREEVEIFPEEMRWKSVDGAVGVTPGATPLDELSFLYHLRMLPLRDGDRHSCKLHFDSERNPVRTRVLERKRINVPAGRFDVVVVEMRVPDSRQANNQGVIRLFVSDDENRVPVRIESVMPRVGTTVLSLESARGLQTKR